MQRIAIAKNVARDILHTWEKKIKTKTPHINMVMYAIAGPVLKNKVNPARYVVFKSSNPK